MVSFINRGLDFIEQYNYIHKFLESNNLDPSILRRHTDLIVHGEIEINSYGNSSYSINSGIRGSELHKVLDYMFLNKFPRIEEYPYMIKSPDFFNLGTVRLGGVTGGEDSWKHFNILSSNTILIKLPEISFGDHSIVPIHREFPDGISFIGLRHHILFKTLEDLSLISNKFWRKKWDV